MDRILLLIKYQRIENRAYYNDSNFLGYTQVVNIDQNMVYRSSEHLKFVIPAVLLCCVLNILPILLLIFYPLRIFRTCLSKCRLDGIAVNIFVEKFHGCYRDGLDGGRDMRSFACLYFFVRIMLFSASDIASLLTISNNDLWFPRNIVFTIAVQLIALCRPYKKMYMNVLDTLLLAHSGLLCHLLSSAQLQHNFLLTVEAMLVLPFAGFILFFAVKAFRKVLNIKMLFQKCKHLCSTSTVTLLDNYSNKSLSTEQSLEISTDYGPVN